jgi:hypothetical protein
LGSLIPILQPIEGLNRHASIGIAQAIIAITHLKKGSAYRIRVKLRVHRHHREVFRQFCARYAQESTFFIETMGGQKLGRRSKKYLLYTAVPAPREKMRQQPVGNAMSRAPMGGFDEHFSQSPLMVANIQQGDAADNIRVVQRHPEVPLSALIKTANIKQIRLLFKGYGNTEFRPLNVKDKVNHTDLVTIRIRDDVDHACSQMLAGWFWQSRL